MVVVDAAAFLRTTPPFDGLPPALLEEAAAGAELRTWPAGACLVRAGGEPLRHLYVVRKGSVRLERDGQTLQVLEEGECFGYTSLLTGKATLDVVVEEELAAYRLPRDVFRRLLREPRFAGHFALGIGERLRASLASSPVATFRADVSQPVSTLLRRPAVWVDEGATVGEAALAMRREDVSSALVRSEPAAIVTDEDLRTRVLAAGLGPATPVLSVASRPLRTVPADAPIYRAWEVLLEAGVSHLPVVDGAGVAGVLAASDLLRCTAQGPVAVLRRVERLASRESLPGYAGKVAEMASALLRGGIEPLLIAGFVSRLNDALLRRILEWAHADLGPAPVPYGWMVFGSEGRAEQTILTDQDNALAFADEGEGQRAWFQAFAERANEDLQAAGFPACPGGYMARNWLGTATEWRGRFAGWIDAPQPEALLQAAIFFDFRRVAGTLDLSALEAIMARTPDRPMFLRLLASTALDQRPPAPLLLRVRGDAAAFDLKRFAINPIVALARCYALEVGSRARNTLERLRQARDAGLMGADLCTTVGEAYRYLLGLRIRVQLRQIGSGRRPTNEVTLGELGGMERSRLKDALRTIRGWQDKAAYHFQAI
jgi:CBS domain-containing protein